MKPDLSEELNKALRQNKKEEMCKKNIYICVYDSTHTKPQPEGGKPHPGRGFPCWDTAPWDAREAAVPSSGCVNAGIGGFEGCCLSPRCLSTGRPLFQAQAGPETTTVPSGLLWMKWEHCMKGTGRMEPALPEQSWAFASPSLKALQAEMGPHKRPAYLRC